MYAVHLSFSSTPRQRSNVSCAFRHFVSLAVAVCVSFNVLHWIEHEKKTVDHVPFSVMFWEWFCNHGMSSSRISDTLLTNLYIRPIFAWWDCLPCESLFWSCHTFHISTTIGNISVFDCCLREPLARAQNAAAWNDESHRWKSSASCFRWIVLYRSRLKAFELKSKLHAIVQFNGLLFFEMQQQ